MIAKLSSPVNRRCDTMSTVPARRGKQRKESEHRHPQCYRNRGAGQKQQEQDEQNEGYVMPPPPWPTRAAWNRQHAGFGRSAPLPAGSDNTISAEPAGCTDKPPHRHSRSGGPGRLPWIEPHPARPHDATTAVKNAPAQRQDHQHAPQPRSRGVNNDNPRRCDAGAYPVGRRRISPSR